MNAIHDPPGKHRLVFHNGKRLKTGTFTFDIMSPFFIGGQSLFETMLVRKGAREPIFRLGAHMKRLRGASERLGWFDVPDTETMKKWIAVAVETFLSETDKDQHVGRCRLTVAWVGLEGPPDVFIVIVPYAVPSDGLTLAVTNIALPWTDAQGAMKTGCRLTYSRAEAFAREKGAGEALLIDRDGRPAEGAKSNLFLLEKDGARDVVITPPVELGILPGVARDSAIAVAGQSGLTVREQPIGWRRFLNAAGEGGVFMTNALWGVRPVGRVIDGERIIDSPGGPSKSVTLIRDQLYKTMYGNHIS